MALFIQRLRLLRKALSHLIDLDGNLNSSIRYNVIKQQLTQRLLYSQERGIASRENPDRPLIVSLTTHGFRIHSVAFAIESMFSQTIKPDHVVLYLGKKEFSERSLPLSLMSQRERGLDIRFIDDIGPHTKLIPALKDYPESIIVTIDDDYMYPFDMLERLMRAHEAYPCAVCCSHSRIMKNNLNGRLSPYDSFEMCFPDSEFISFNLLAEGFGGVLYPPHSLSEEVFNFEQLSMLAPSADDLWFKAMELLVNTPVVQIARTRDWFQTITSEFSVQDSGLKHYNNDEKGNDRQLESLFSHYDLYRKLQECL